MAWPTVHFGIFQLQGWPGCCITGSDEGHGKEARRGEEEEGGRRGTKVGKAPSSQPGAPAKSSYRG